MALPSPTDPLDVRLDSLLALLGGASDADYVGEPVSQLAHALQAAAAAAAHEPWDPELVLAALLHDIGHLAPGVPQMQGLGARDHERIGRAILRRAGLGSRIQHLVAGHVDAKRYLVATDAAYDAELSPASRATLALQGGPMSPDEILAFEADPDGDAILALRRCDEAAKVPGQSVPGLGHYRPLLRHHLELEAARAPADSDS